jgi:hypothetical protein
VAVGEEEEEEEESRRKFGRARQEMLSEKGQAVAWTYLAWCLL